MAEVIAVLGGVATVSQVLVYLANTTRNTISYYNGFTDAPKVLDQIKEKLHIFQQIIDQMQSYASQFEDGDVFTTETKELLLQCVSRVHSSLKKCEVATRTNIKKKMKRVAWVLRDEPALYKLLDDLDDSNRALNLVMQLFIMKTLQYQSTVLKGDYNENKEEKLNKPRVGVAISSSNYISSWPSLRQLGFYGTFKTRPYSQCLLDADVFLGYQFPSWLWSKSVEFELNIRIPTFIRMQNRVQADSPFMVACRAGDIARIRQYLADKSGSVGDRLICTGETPLMLSIQSGSINAVKALLDAGADPNIGDDDGIAPMFFALGMDPRRNTPCPQIPPKNFSWMDILRLLADHNGSVHEVVHGNSLSALNVVWDQDKNRTLEFFHFLRDECYVDFDAQKDDGWSACTNALRSGGSALQCVKFLQMVGLDFSRISTDGRSYLHVGAELAQDAEAFEYFCQTCRPHLINRQDDMGWTALHYTIAFEAMQQPQDSLAKIEALVRRGADRSLNANHFAIINIDKDKYTAFDLGEALRSDLYEQFLAILKDSGHDIPEDANEKIFHETTDSWPVPKQTI